MGIQDRFFEEIRKQGIKGKTLTSMLCTELHISADSAYRRLRGETSLSFKEIRHLSLKFNISLDALFDQETRHVPFRYNWLESDRFNYTAYLASLKEDAERLSLFEDNEILFVAKDLPFFSNFIVPEIGEFKGFFWQKVALELKSFKSVLFDIRKPETENVRLGYEILKAYNHIPSKELWHPDMLNGLLNQILFCHDKQYFKHSYTAMILLEKLEDLLAHYQLQAIESRKFLYGKEATFEESNFGLYYNDVLIGDNTTCLRVGHHKTIYFTHNIINNIVTRNDDFAEQTWNIQERLMNRSMSLTGKNNSFRENLFTQFAERIKKTKMRLQKGV